MRTMMVAMAAVAALVVAGGCAAQHPEVSGPAQSAAAADVAANSGRYAAGHAPLVADIAMANGTVVGKAWVKPVSGGVAVSVTVNAPGLAAGMHGVHIHTVGKCDAPDFASAGGHWNPTAHQHGSMNPMGPHLGDLPNLTIGADGQGKLDFTVAGATIEGLLDADGSAIVIHAAPDDLKTDPSGNSGARLACGVLAVPANA